ncbi:MAG TPA: GMC family oxidoreductase N-terminal domain-containing protein, partial [Actinomycetota bacterium]|nr:GMC family oxidoreductase N-terminal domain-containing protein [Actinomycetota bacterium]
MPRDVAFDDVHAVFAALAKGVLGPRYSTDLPRRMYDTTRFFPSEAERSRILGVFKAMSSRAGALALTGKAVPVSWLTPAEAERVVAKWRDSRLPLQRQLAGAVISLASNCLYGYPTPEWDRFNYAGPLSDPPAAGTDGLSPKTFDSDTELECDVVIVGSGAGGGCAAAVLAEAGLDVVVLEKGGHYEEKDFHHLESQAMQEMYLYGGALLTNRMTCRIIAGSAIGGGTLVNYATAWKTPEPVLRDWHRVSGIDAFVNGEIQASLDVVGERVNINHDETAPGRRDALIEEGLTKLGWHVDVFPKAVKGCRQDASCGYCGFGCRVGAKQGTMKTFLPDAVGAGARLYSGTDVHRVTIKDGRAIGVEGSAGPYRFSVRARSVVVAGGSIETPALLLRSGLKGRVGHDLRLHPGTPAWAFFDEEVRAWDGTTQTRYSFELARADDHYGATLETVPVHPGAAGGVLPWLSEKEHRTMMNKLDRLGFCGVLARDTTSGRVSINKDGSPKI